MILSRINLIYYWRYFVTFLLITILLNLIVAVSVSGQFVFFSNLRKNSSNFCVRKFVALACLLWLNRLFFCYSLYHFWFFELSWFLDVRVWESPPVFQNIVQCARFWKKIAVQYKKMIWSRINWIYYWRYIVSFLWITILI
jgi:hypothetical protein